MKRRLLTVAALLCLLLTACHPQVTPDPEPEPEPPVPVYVPDHCTTATLMVAGDAMSHMPQTDDALACGGGKSYDYTKCLQYVQPIISSSDYAIVNLETVFRQGREPSGFPSFNTPASFGAALRYAGFDMVTTANNHSYDQRFQGLCDTLDQLDLIGMAHVGTYRTQEEFDENMGVAVIDIGGISAAVLDYTYGLNGYVVEPEHDFCVNRFNVDYTSTISQLDTNKLSTELSYAKRLNTDLVIVMIHWGVEYQLKENSYQDHVADFLIANGADLVLGGHSHTPQPLQHRTVTAADGSIHQGFVCFSLGNFLSNQQWEYSDITALLELQITKNWTSGDVTISQAGYYPCLMLRLAAGVTPRYYLLPAYETMAAYENGTAPYYIGSDTYSRLKKCVNDCQNIFGAEFDLHAKEG